LRTVAALSLPASLSARSSAASASASLATWESGECCDWAEGGLELCAAAEKLPPAMAATHNATETTQASEEPRAFDAP
jgi:hypothetical protein